MTNLEQKIKVAEAKLAKAKEALEAKKEDKKNAEKALRAYIAQQKRKERAEKEKARTHRLIKIGAEMERIAGGEIDFDKLNIYLTQYQGAIKNLKKEDAT